MNGDLLGQFATAGGLMAAGIGVGGFVFHAGPALGDASEAELRHLTVAGGYSADLPSRSSSSFCLHSGKIDAMTLNKACTLIVVGMVLLGGLLGVPLVLMKADGTAYALVMVTALSIGGIANYFAVKRYGVGRGSAQDRPERVPGQRV
jgi:hypothetical protein